MEIQDDDLFDDVDVAADVADDDAGNTWLDQLQWRGMWGHTVHQNLPPALAHADHLMLNDYVWGRVSAREVAKALVSSAPELPWPHSFGEAATRSVIVSDIEHMLGQMAYRMTPEDIAAEQAYRKSFRRLVRLGWRAEWEACEKDPALAAIRDAFNALGSRRYRCPRPTCLDSQRASYALYFALAEHVGSTLPTLEVWRLLDGALAVGREDLAERLLGDFRATSEWGDEHQSEAGIAVRRRIAIVEQQEDIFVHALHGRVSFEDAVSLRGHVVAHAYHLLHGWANHHAHAPSPSAYR